METLAAIDRTGAYVSDGHASVEAMVRHYGKLSAGEAAARAKGVSAGAALPDIAARAEAGTFGVEQLRLLGRVHANPCVRDRMGESEQWFIEQHDRHDFRDFERLVRRWEKLVDELRLPDRRIAVPDHGLAVVMWTSRKPPTVAAHTREGELVGSIALADHRPATSTRGAGGRFSYMPGSVRPWSS